MGKYDYHNALRLRTYIFFWRNYYSPYPQIWSRESKNNTSPLLHGAGNIDDVASSLCKHHFVYLYPIHSHHYLFSASLSLFILCIGQNIGEKGFLEKNNCLFHLLPFII